MKLFCTLLVTVTLLFTGTSFAQEESHDHDHKKPELEIGESVQYPDGSRAYRTFDPHGNDVTVVIEPKMPKLPDFPEDNVDHPDFVPEIPEMELRHAFKGKPGGSGGGGTVVVNVYAVADEEYRAAHSNWTSTIGGIIEKADNAYNRDQKIDWNIVGYYEWNSRGRSASQILSNLSSDSSGMGPGLVMGFSADPNFEAGGIAYVYNSDPGTGVSVCVDQGSTWTAYALRHEAGHNYGAHHDFDPVKCLMNYTYAYSIDYFDAAHEALIDSHRNWFQ